MTSKVVGFLMTSKVVGFLMTSGEIKVNFFAQSRLTLEAIPKDH